MSRQEELKKIIRQLRKRVNRLEAENRVLREQYRQDILDWQRACSILEEDLMEYQERKVA